MGLADFLSFCMQKCRVRILLKFMVLTIGASTMFVFTAHQVFYRPASDVSKLGPAFALIDKAGNSHLDYFEEFAESTDEEKIDLMNKMRNSMKSLLRRCAKRKIICTKSFKQTAILTMFTTWVYEKEKFHIYNKTLYNWRSLPGVNLVVFTNSNEVTYFSKRAGFNVLPILEEASGAPVLPAMFRSVMNNFQSEFYGFVNGDILFTETLVNTLKHIYCHLGKRGENGVLIVGRRVNVPARLINDDTAKSWKDLDKISRTGSLFQSDAEDYFITDKTYPWHKFLPVAIGRRAYDNWVVAFSRYHNITVIDATESIQCLHQTLESRGNFEGLDKGRYNIELIDKLKLPFSPYSWGRTLCAGMKSWTNLCGDVVLSERFKLDSQCTSYHTFHQIFKLLGFGK